MTYSPPFCCSDLSREHKEEIYGTAGRGNVWVLLEYPKPWTKRLVVESGLPEDVKAHLRNLMETIPNSRMLFITQPSSGKSKIRLFVVVCQEEAPYAYQFCLGRYEELVNINIPAVVTGQDSQGAVKDYSPMYLVCTDGKHDVCCAKYGFPTYKALRDYAGEVVWESSHVGGDRFAANVVCFPHGIFYGHVTQQDLRGIVDGYKAQRLHLSAYRGRACYSRQAQVGEYLVRNESGIVDLNALHLIDVSDNTDKEEWEARFSSAKYGKIYEVTFSSFKSPFEYCLTCTSTERKHVAQYTLHKYSANDLPS